MPAPDHTTAANLVIDWIAERSGHDGLTAVGHRVVHGGPKYSAPQRITAQMVEDLRQLSPFDPDHLPEEILLAEAVHRRYPDIPQVACFDTAFHHDLPRVAQMLPIPRRYEAQGVRRYGFHGLSYAYLMDELARLGDPGGNEWPGDPRPSRQRRQPGRRAQRKIHRYQHELYAGGRNSDEHALRRSRPRARVDIWRAQSR